jgi:hypothetical protein
MGLISLFISLISLIIAIIALKLQIKSNAQILTMQEQSRELAKQIYDTGETLKMYIVAHA